MAKLGKLYGVGVGPGDPELITLKGLKAIKAADIIVYHQAAGKKSNALSIAECWLEDRQIHLPLIYPVTTETLADGEDYETLLGHFYNEITANIAQHLDSGKTITVLAEGDPLFYSSFMYIYDRLADIYETQIIPGITSISGAASALGVPLCYRNQSFSVLSGVLSKEALKARLSSGDAFAIMKLGRNLDKVRDALDETGLHSHALYIERATMATERTMPLSEVSSEHSPYFSLILVPGEAPVSQEIK